MTDEFNGLAFDTTGRHSKIIPMTLGTMTGGLNDSTVYRMTLQQDEHHIYGSSRLGVSKHDAGLSRAEFIAAPQPVSLNGSNLLDVFADYFQTAGTFGVVTLTAAPTHTVSLDVEKDVGFAVIGTSDTLDGFLILGKVGNKTYEYSNHLGNVLLTTSDRHLAQDGNADDLVDYFAADVLSYSDYYPYGMAMVGRNTNLSSYRFGYQGSEMDNSHKGNGNSYSTYFRQLDPRLGRWMSIDPVIQPWQSPYTSMDDNPIKFNDIRGDKVTKTPGGTTNSILGGRVSIFQNNNGSTFLNVGSFTTRIPKGLAKVFTGGGKFGAIMKVFKLIDRATPSSIQSTVQPPGIKNGGKPRVTDYVLRALASEFTNGDQDKASDAFGWHYRTFTDNANLTGDTRTAAFGAKTKTSRKLIDKNKLKLSEDQLRLAKDIQYILNSEIVTEITIIFDGNANSQGDKEIDASSKKVTNNNNFDALDDNQVTQLTRVSNKIMNGSAAWGFLTNRAGDQNVEGILIIDMRSTQFSAGSSATRPTAAQINEAIITSLQQYSRYVQDN